MSHDSSLRPTGLTAPSAPVPKATLVETTTSVALTIVGFLAFVVLVSTLLGCMPTFAPEAAAMVALTAVWAWFTYRLCRRIRIWILATVKPGR